MQELKISSNKYPTLLRLKRFSTRERKYVVIRYYFYGQQLQENNDISWQWQELKLREIDALFVNQDRDFVNGELFLSPESNVELYQWVEKNNAHFHTNQKPSEQMTRYKRYQNYLPFIRKCLQDLGFKVYLDTSYDTANNVFPTALAKQLRPDIKVVHCLSSLYKYKISKDEHVASKESEIVNYLWFTDKLKSEDICSVYFEPVQFYGDFIPARLGTGVHACDEEGLENSDLIDVLEALCRGVLKINQANIKVNKVFKKTWRELEDYLELEKNPIEEVKSHDKRYAMRKQQEERDKEKKNLAKFFKHAKKVEEGSINSEESSSDEKTGLRYGQ